MRLLSISEQPNIKSANAKALKNNLFKQGKNELLKTLIIYGANAYGQKQTSIKAIRFCNAMVFESHNHNQDTVFNFQPFKFDGYQRKPGTYFIRFILNEIEYEYSFSLTRNAIISESLHYYPKGRIKEIFTRNENRGKTKKEKYTFTDVIKRTYGCCRKHFRKTHYISRASQMDRDIAKDIFNYFHNTFILNYLGFGVSAIENISNQNKKQLIEALKIADSDIEDVK